MQWNSAGGGVTAALAACCRGRIAGRRAPRMLGFAPQRPVPGAMWVGPPVDSSPCGARRVLEQRSARMPQMGRVDSPEGRGNAG